MLNEPTIDKLKALKLYAMITAWVAQRAEPSMNDLHFDERLALIVEAETLARDNKRLTKLLHDAKLRIPSACMEDVELSPKREIDKPLFRQLATGRWIADRQNVLITGATGVGKTTSAPTSPRSTTRASARGQRSRSAMNCSASITGSPHGVAGKLRAEPRGLTARNRSEGPERSRPSSPERAGTP